MFQDSTAFKAWFQSCVCLLVLLAGTGSSWADEDPSDDAGFRPLFNGRNLDGWVPVNTAPSTWSVKDGMLVCSGKPIGEFRTDRMYQNFVLEVEWRHMVPRGNAGIFVWADDITAPGVPFHRSIEVQVLENAYGNGRGHTTHGDIFPIHGARMTPVNGRGGSRAFPTENRSKPSPEWNHYTITCQDGEVSLAVNGKVVTRGRDASPRKGYICIESEGGIVHYRNMRIRELPASPIKAEDVAISDRGYRSIYTGVDLSGWKTAEGGAGHWKSKDWVLAYDGASTGSDRSLTSAESFADVGFIVDVRRKADTGTLSITVGGADAIAFENDDNETASLRKAGQWNRIEGTLQGNKLSVSVNGTPLFEGRTVERPVTGGPLSLEADGPVDFANIYVRDADLK